MILHTTSKNFVILNDKLLIENGKKSNTDHFVCHMVIHNLSKPNRRQNVNMNLFCRSTLLKNQVSFISRLKDERFSDIAVGKFKFDFIWTWTVHLTRDILLASLFFFL